MRKLPHFFKSEEKKQRKLYIVSHGKFMMSVKDIAGSLVITFSQNFSSLALAVWDLEEKAESMNELILMLCIEQRRLHRVC